MRFRMRPQAQVMLMRVICRACKIALHDVYIDNERGRIEISDAHYF